MKEQLSNTVQEVFDNKFDSAEALKFMKDLEKHLKKCISEVETKVYDDYEENTEHSKFEIQFRSGGWSYDFSNLKDVVFKENELKQLKESYKNKFLNTDGFDQSTGEVFDNLPNRKPRKSSVIIKDKNNGFD